MSLETDLKLITNKCTPRNALFCCSSPVCLNNNSPKLVPVTMEQNQSNVFPVNVPDLSDPMFYTNLMSHPKVTIDSTNASEMGNGSNAAPSITMNKSQSAQDIRHGISLRRVTPPKRTVTVKKSEAPLMNVVLRKVEKKLLEPPKPAKHEKSPPPKKLTNTIDANTANTKKTRTALNNQNAIAKSKSTNDVIGKQKENVQCAIVNETVTVPKPLPPINLLKAHRPPLEIHKIEGDKIIIIRRVPRSHRALKKNASLPSIPQASNQVTITVTVLFLVIVHKFISLLIILTFIFIHS